MAEGYSELAAHGAVIDIANQPYNEFSEYWKEQNRGGAEFWLAFSMNVEQIQLVH